MLDGKVIVSLATPDGKVTGDLTQYMDNGDATRTRRGISSAKVGLSNHRDVWPLLRALKDDQPYGTWLICEEEKANGKRDLIWGGPVMSAHRAADSDGYDIIALDQGSYWSRLEIIQVNYKAQDVAHLVHTFLRDNLAQNLNAVPVFEVFDTGSNDEIGNVEANNGIMIDSVMNGFPVLNYTFIGKTLFLFGVQSESQAYIELTDESWTPLPVVGMEGASYANNVIVKGSGVIGRASIVPPAHLGVITRRFDLPEIVEEGLANSTARDYLNQMLNAEYLNAEGTKTLNKGDEKVAQLEINDLIPGKKVEVSSTDLEEDFVDMYTLDQVTIDLVERDVSIGLSGFGIAEEVNAG